MRLIRKGKAMKRTGYIYERVCDIENIKTAILKSSLGKRRRKYVRKILDNIDGSAKEISDMLRAKTYTPSPYTIKTIMDGASGKERTIYKPRFFPDQIIHWALMLQLQPLLMKGMYAYNCGSIPNRGTSYGQNALRKWLDTDKKNTKYCLKMDIRHFYPTIDNELLKQSFRRFIKDEDCLWLIDTIIDSNKGLPIGNYTSQWFANFFLQGLDHFIKEELKAKYYIRYVDDLVILGGNKRKLHKIREAIDGYLRSLHLEMKQNWQVFKISKRPIDFLGLKFYCDKTILRKRTSLRIRRRANKISKKPSLSFLDACAIISYWGWIKRSNSYHFYQKYVRPKVSIAKARKVVSNHGKAEALRRNPRV
jgi:RNA-directed DNA polymerase